MPYRRLPNTDQARVRALKAAVEKGDVYNVRDLAISLKTLFEARNFLLKFEAAQIYYTQCYDSQSQASGECADGTAVYIPFYSSAQPRGASR